MYLLKRQKIPADGGNYEEMQCKNQRQTDHEFSVPRLMMDQSHGEIHGQRCAYGGYQHQGEFRDSLP